MFGIKEAGGIIQLPKTKHRAKKGVFGLYFKINSKVGVKVIKFYSNWEGSEKYSYKILMNRTRREAGFIRMANKKHIGPKLYAIKKVLIAGNLYPCIIMEHITGIHSLSRYRKISLDISEKLKSIGLLHSDLHSGNVLFLKKGEYRVIDFGPNGVSKLRKRKKR